MENKKLELTQLELDELDSSSGGTNKSKNTTTDNSGNKDCWNTIITYNNSDNIYNNKK